MPQGLVGKTASSLDINEKDAEGWDAVAAGWARWWRIYERSAQPVSDRLVALGEVGPGHTILDVATGLGEPAITAARRVGRHGRVIATDSAPAMLHEAAARALAIGLSNLEFREMNAETPDIADISFDAILCRWGLMFVSDLEGSLRRLLALLRPGGRLATAVWGNPEEVPLIQTSASVLSERVPLPDEPGCPIGPFRLCERGLLDAAMRQAGFAGVTHEELPVTFEFASPEEYTRFRRDMTVTDSSLAGLYPSDVVEAAWQAVTEAARALATEDGRIRFVNTAICISGRR